MKIGIVNGPNLNLLGKREPHVYGSASFDDYFDGLQRKFPQVQFTSVQTNVEGELINYLHAMAEKCDGIVLNPGGYTHTSVALGDAIAAIAVPVIEVHISNTAARESFRHISHVSAKAKGTITGLGLTGYELAVTWLLQHAGQ